ncbi:MAG: ferredoxin [Streptosporangiales bacterium]|nr:ferredoxin [Streptosporangiales bacterium]
MTRARLSSGGGGIDRMQPITVNFDGVDYPAYAGDTLASALLANGVWVAAHGIYTGRPRGIVGVGMEEPGAYVQVESGAGEPMVPATTVEAYDGLRAHSLAGKGKLLGLSDSARYDHVHAHCDVLVVGGGIAGRGHALAAARDGERVVLCDATPPGARAVELDALARYPDTRVLARTTVVGAYDHNYFVAHERRTDHLGIAAPDIARQRLWHIRAKRVVFATGSVERPYAFPDNDRPGVMLAGAAAAYVTRYAVLPGSRAVVAGVHDGALEAAVTLVDAGVDVAAVIDVRPLVAGHWVEELRRRGIEVRAGEAICGTEADESGVLAAVRIASVDGNGVVQGPASRVECDLLAVSGGVEPSVALFSQLGGGLAWSVSAAAFVPLAGERDGVECVGAAAGGITEGGGTSAGALFAVRNDDADTADRTFVDLQRDVTLADVERAVRVGMVGAEHVKRYTTIGTGPDQGRTVGTLALGVLAGLTGRSITEMRPTTYRPPLMPIPFALMAGRNRGRLADPERVTAMHPWHVHEGVPFEDVGQWKRLWYAPKPGEDMPTAVRRECRAVRESVGMMDASTLGKIELQGRDVGTFLDQMYTNTFSTLKVGRIRYGVMCHADGMVFDDGTTARLTDDRWLMSTTTGNAAAVLDWLEEWLFTEWPHLDVRCTSVTDHWATVAVAGPRSRDVLAAVAPSLDVSAGGFPFMSVREAEVAGRPARVMRISFSGELAYEVNVPAWYGMALWGALLDAGAPYGITVYGTETMHVLRAEKGFPIVGQDTDGTVTPQDLGMSWAVSKKKSFVGKRSYARADNLRDDRKQLVGLFPEGDQVIEEGAQLVVDPNLPPPVPMAGHVTSSYWSVPLDRPYALALVEGGAARHGEQLYAVHDGHAVPVTVTSPLVYDPDNERRDGAQPSGEMSGAAR